QWTAVVDVASLLQTDDVFQLREEGQDLCVPDLESLLPLCCQHPCGPQVDPRWYGADGYWPAAPVALPALTARAPASSSATPAIGLPRAQPSESSIPAFPLPVLGRPEIQ